MNIFFYKYRNKQAYLWIFKNVFKSFSFQKISDFLVDLQTIQTFDFKHYLWTHQHFICWRFSKYLYSQGTSESREIILSDGCSLFLNEPNNINFWKCNISNNVWHVNTTGCIMLMNGDECCLFHIYSMLWYSIESRQPPDVSAVWFGGVTGWYQSFVYSELACRAIHWYATINQKEGLT